MKRNMTAVASCRRKSVDRNQGPEGKILFLSAERDMIRAAVDGEGKSSAWTRLAVPHGSEVMTYTHTFNYTSIALYSYFPGIQLMIYLVSFVPLRQALMEPRLALVSYVARAGPEFRVLLSSGRCLSQYPFVSGGNHSFLRT